MFELTKITTLLTHGPKLLLEYLELTHVIAYPMVLINFGLFCWIRLSTESDYFWTAVLLAGYGCYGCLPWLQIRTPLYLERNNLHTKRDLIFRRLNFFVRNMASMHVSTFPSSHIAINVAAALVIISMDSKIGILSVMLATSMAVSTVFGTLSLFLKQHIWRACWRDGLVDRNSTNFNVNHRNINILVLQKTLARTYQNNFEYSVKLSPTLPNPCSYNFFKR